MFKNFVFNNILPLYRTVYFISSSFILSIYMLKIKVGLRSLGGNTRIFFANIAEPFNIEIGHHVYINKNCDLITTGSKIKIGNYVMIGPNTTIVAQNHDFGDWRTPMILNKNYSLKNVEVCDDVWIGANVTILPGVTIGRGSVIGAGSVVTGDVPEYSIYAGVPAKKIRSRFDKKLIKKAKTVDLAKFKDEKIDWFKWGVGGKAK